MDILTAHGKFALRQDRSNFDYYSEIECDDGPCDIWPAMATAAVMVAGALDVAETDADLDEAIGQYVLLVREGIIDSHEPFAEALTQVIDAVMAWSDDLRL